MDSKNQLRSRWPALLVCVALAGSVFAVYWPVTRYEFVNFDDIGYIIQNRHVQHGFNWDDIRWAFTSFYAGNWHPLTWLSHTLDWQLYHLKSGGHHLTNVVLHAINTVLLFIVLLRLTQQGKAPNSKAVSSVRCQGPEGNGASTFWACAIVAGLFGLHPMHVESVAWIAERKDVLSTFFFLLTIWAYAKYVSGVRCQEEPEVQSSKFVPGLFYILALLFFALGLMSKPMLVTTPFVLLLLDYWPLRRVASGEWRVTRANSQTPKLSNSQTPILPLLLEKLPFFALSAAESALTFFAQRHTGAVASTAAAPIETRIFNAIISYGAYVKKMFWPGAMAVYYPFREHPELGEIAGGVLVLLIGTAVAIGWGRRRPYLAFGWFWFVGTLVPVIGLVQVGLQSMADRYTYIPYIGLFVAIVWLIRDLVVARGPCSRGLVVTWSVVLWSAAIGILAACGVSAAHQVRYWQTSEMLWRQAVNVTSGNVVARQNLGSALVEQRRFAEGAEQFEEALKIKPMYAEAESNFGFALYMLGRLDEAVEHYQRALSMKPIGRTHYLLAMVLLQQGKHAEAVAEYKRAIELEPELPPALNDLAWILATDPDPALRDGQQAVIMAERACQASLVPDPQLIGTLAAAYAEAGRFPDAIAAAERAKDLATKQGNLALAQRNEELLQYYRRGEAYHETGK
jgi:Tfp pilus assembly protein PilF